MPVLYFNECNIYMDEHGEKATVFIWPIVKFEKRLDQTIARGSSQGIKVPSDINAFSITMLFF